MTEARRTGTGRSSEFVDTSTDIFAATRIVDSGGAGTDLTLTDALAALPTAGGTIFIKTAAIAVSSGFTIPNKPVKIIGAGKGVTTFTMTGAFVLFTGGTQDLWLADFNVVGDNTSTQTFLSTGSDTNIERVDIEDVRYIIQASSTPEILFRDCLLRPAGSAGTTSFWKGATNGKMIWDNVEIFVPTSGNNLIEGATTGSAGCSLIAVDSYTGGGGGGPATNFYFTQRIEFTNMQIDNAQFLVNAAQNKIDNSFFEDSSVRFTGVWNQISNTVFSGGGTDGALYDSQIAVILAFSVPAETTITGCEFYGNSASVYGVTIDNSFDVVISGCDFYNHTSAGVHLTSGTSPHASEAVAVGNNFDGSTILEDDSNCIGLYDSNKGWSPAASNIQGTTTIVRDENVRSVSIDTTLNAVHRTVVVDASGGAKVITLPAANTAPYRKYTVKKIDSSGNTVTVTRAGADTIDGATTYVLSAQYDFVEVQSNGSSSWWVTSK